MPIHDAATFLFVPADRPERFSKALQAGADAIIIDLEDAVAPANKEAAREALFTALQDLKGDGMRLLRINASSTRWHDEDLRLAERLPIDGVVLPKAEQACEVEAIRRLAGSQRLVVALVETARGLAAARDIACAADRIAFGSVDLATDLGCAHERQALLHARSEIVLAARLADKPAPIDGVTLSVSNAVAIEDDARYARGLGFGAKLLVHPAQIEPARRGLAPDDTECAWALKIVESAQDGSARAVDGEMVDTPVLERARRILMLRNRLLGEAN